MRRRHEASAGIDAGVGVIGDNRLLANAALEVVRQLERPRLGRFALAAGTAAEPRDGRDKPRLGHCVYPVISNIGHNHFATTDPFGVRQSQMRTAFDW